MKFDLSWFKTIPGLLITGGVVLLIIALIIFIVTSKNNKKDQKNTKEKNKENSSDSAVSSEQVTGVSQSATDNSVATVSNSVESPNNNNSVVEFSNEAVGTPELSSVEAQPVAMNPVDVANNVSAAQSLNPVVENVPLENNVSTDVEMVSSAPVVETPVVSPSVETISVSDVSSSNLGGEMQAPLNTDVLSNGSNTVLPVEQLTPSNDVTVQDLPSVVPATPSPVVENVEPLEVASTITPVLDVSTISNIPTVEATVVPNVPTTSDTIPTVSDVAVTPENHTIYGGVSQIIPDMNLGTNVDNHQIYGGANPLENTQTLPVVDNSTTSAQPSIMPNISDTPVVSVIPNDVPATIPVVPVTNNMQSVPINNNPVMPTSAENVSVPTGIPAVQVVATAPIMPPENQ